MRRVILFHKLAVSLATYRSNPGATHYLQSEELTMISKMMEKSYKPRATKQASTLPHVVVRNPNA